MQRLLMTLLLLLAPSLALAALPAGGLPVTPERPRVLVTPQAVAQMQARRNANDPAWLALKARADYLKTLPVQPYNQQTLFQGYNGTIFYSYQGWGWEDAAMPLGLAWLVTGDPAYATKLLELADEMVRAETAPENQPPNVQPPFDVDHGYPSRHLGKTIAVIYDWCYDVLGPQRRAAMAGLMKTYFGKLRTYPPYYTHYQNLGPATGNYYAGHMTAAGFMGYALAGDDPAADVMIAWARARLDGTTSSLLASNDYPAGHRAQAFEGGLVSRLGKLYGVPANLVGTRGAPLKAGVSIQGWGYAGHDFAMMIEYMATIRTATGEDVVGAKLDWFRALVRAFRHSVLPATYLMDPIGDYGGNQGAIIYRMLPSRLAWALAGTPEGPAAQHLAYSVIPPNSSYGYYTPAAAITALEAWETFLFRDPALPSAPPQEPAYYSGFGPAYPKAGPTNGVYPYFIMRSDWGSDAVWASARMGAAFWDDHQHHDAGHVQVYRGGDALLVSGANWRGPATGPGIVGSGIMYNPANAVKNTLFVDDHGTYYNSTNGAFQGGQSQFGRDQVVAAEETDALTYVRSDLSTAYTELFAPRTLADTTRRPVKAFHRAFVYLRPANLFVVFDRVQMRAAPAGAPPHDERLRWHLAGVPQVAGNRVTIQHGGSRLALHTLLPAQPALTTSWLMNNPDHTLGPNYNYMMKADLYRVEVRDPVHRLDTDFLTAIQVGPSTMQEMTSAALATADSSMIGARFELPGATPQVVLFNNGPGQVPAPVAFASYPLGSAPGAVHTLLGMDPGAAYAVTVAGGQVYVGRDPAGNLTASPAGVLQFSPATLYAATDTQVRFAAAGATAGEGAGAVTVPVLLVNPDPSHPTTVQVAVVGGTAGAADFGPFAAQTLTFAEGSAEAQTVVVPILDDTLPEGAETIVLGLQNVSGGANATAQPPLTFTITLVDDDAKVNAPPVFTAVMPATTANAGSTVTFTFQASDPDGDALVFSLVGPPAGASIHPTTGQFGFTPQAAGTYPITVRVADGGGLTATTTTTVTAQAPPPPGGGTPSDDGHTVIAWTFDDQNLVADGGTAANVTRAMAAVPARPRIAYATGNGGVGFAAGANDWVGGAGVKAWQTGPFATLGFTSLTVSSRQRSAATGPRDFKIQYSLDGQTWADVPGGAVAPVTREFETGGRVDALPLPAACDDRPAVYLRWIMTSNLNTTGGAIAASSVNHLDDVRVDGVAASAGKTGGDGVPDRAFLDAAYPNPFNPSTQITFGLPEAGPVRLAVYDLLGREVEVLADGALAAGVHTVTFEARDLSSGVYLYRLQTPAGVITRRMLLMK